MPDLKEIARVSREFLKIMPEFAFKPPQNSDANSVGKIFEETAARMADRTMIIFEGRT